MAPRRESMDDQTVSVVSDAGAQDLIMATAAASTKMFTAPSLVQQLPPVAEGCTRLYLCRHGQTEFNRLHKFQGRGVNTALNETGQLQASYLAQSMRNVPLRAIYSSTLRRARETATIVSQLHQKIELQHFQDLEEMSFGVFEGSAHELYDDQVQAIHHKWLEGDYAARFPNGENPLEVVARGVAKINSIMTSSQPQDHVLIVTHGRFNKVVLTQMLHGELSKMHDLTQDNTCVNVVDYDHVTHAYTPVLLNSTSHLPTSPAV
ncbi:putative phosphatase phoe, partial [Globisporangium splendens]